MRFFSRTTARMWSRRSSRDPPLPGPLVLLSRSARRLKRLGETMLLEEDGVEEGCAGEGVEEMCLFSRTRAMMLSRRTSTDSPLPGPLVLLMEEGCMLLEEDGVEEGCVGEGVEG